MRGARLRHSPLSIVPCAGRFFRLRRTREDSTPRQRFTALFSEIWIRKVGTPFSHFGLTQAAHVPGSVLILHTRSRLFKR